MPIFRSFLVALVTVTVALSACGPLAPNIEDAGFARDAGAPAGESDAGQRVDAGAVDSGQPLVDAGSGLPDPVLFIHGINGGAADWDVMVARLKSDGWPADRLMARSFADPKWGCNVDNAETVKTWANALMAATHTARIDLVAHSMGTLSSRRFVKALGGAAVVNTYVMLGGMNHGLGGSVCLGGSLPICVWKELCQTGAYIAELNAPPATPGPTTWVTISGAADETVPNESTYLDGAENIVVPNVTHDGLSGLQSDPIVYGNVVRVLRYPGH